MTTVPQVKMNVLQRARFFVNMASDFLGTQERLFNEYGDIYRYDLVGTSYFPVRHPEHVRDVLVKNAGSLVKDTDFNNPNRGLSRFIGSGLLVSTGDFWKRQRKLVAPAFHAGRVSEYADMIADYGEELVASWDDGDEFALLEEMSKLTHNIISRTLLSETDPAATQEVTRTIVRLQKKYLRAMMLPDMLVSQLMDEFDTIMARFDAVLYPIIQAYRADGRDRGDLLSMLLMVEGADGERMTDKEVRDEAISLLLAGHETTGATLTWATMLLGQHPNALRRVQAEADTLSGKRPTLMDLRRLPYTEQVIKEIMRLYPGAPLILRRADEDVTVGGYHIPAGGVLVVSPYYTGRHPGIWERPTHFDPERFAPENADKIDKWAYFPFGGGPRVCLGQSFAQMEVLILLTIIASQVELQIPAGYHPQAETGVTMYPKDKLPVTVRRRRATDRQTDVA